MEKTTSISIRELAVLSVYVITSEISSHAVYKRIYIISLLSSALLTVIDPGDVGIGCADSAARDRGIFAIQDGHILRRLFHHGGRGCGRREKY